VLVGCLVWAAAVAAGFTELASYAGRAGQAADAPATWPTTSSIPRRDGRATLVMIAHARCPCTRASLRELERLLARVGAETDAFVVFEGPPASDAADDLRRAAASIAGVRVLEDAHNAEARRFGAQTSGQVVVYDARGALLFAGGITPARGHEGDNAGSTALQRLLNHDTTPRSQSGTSVFGCSLFARKEP
jgi:hypothetical protein